jgi:RNA polymerase sigma-70 factor (ECF subfamily)
LTRRCIKLDATKQIEEWFRQFADDVYKFLVYFTGTTDVEDIVQETFIKALKAMNSYQGRSSPKTWLLAIARNVARDSRRKNRRNTSRHIPYEYLANASSSERTPEEAAELSDAVQSVMSMLQSVSPQQRAVLVLRGMYELTGEETAQVLGWTQSKVNVTYHRAIKAVRRAYQAKREVNFCHDIDG